MTSTETASVHRLVTLADVAWLTPEIARWLFDEFGHNYPGSTIESYELKLRERCQREALPLTLVAMLDYEPVGTLSIIIEARDGLPSVPWVSAVFTFPAKRGRGVARALLDEAERVGAQLGLKSLYLSAAIPTMYAKLGYETIGVARNGEPIMMKEMVPQH